DACERVVGAPGPESGAEAVDDLLRFFKGLAGRALLTRSTSDRSGCQECASVLEWTAHASVLSQRAVERFECAFDVPASLAQQSAAAGGRGKRPRTARACGQVFVAGEPGVRFAKVAGADHRLDRIRPSEVCWLAPAVR